jgi:hypothetical protein
LIRLEAAIVDNKFLEIAYDAQWEFCRPGVTAKLKCRTNFIFYVYRGLFSFEKELASTANSEAIIRSFCCFADLDGVFVNDILVSFRVS